MNRTQSRTLLAAAAGVVLLCAGETAHAQRGGGGRSGGRSTGAVRGGDRGGRTVVVASPYVYSPFFYDAWFYDPWYGDPYAYGYPLAGFHTASSSVRLQVEPPQTEVFVDGYYAGPVDEFDGVFQRLRVEPGEHDLELYLQGYKSVRQKVFLQPDDSFRIRYTMQPLAAGEQQEPRPVAPPSPSGGDPGVNSQPPASARFGRVPEGGPRDVGDFGAIAIRIQPADADVLVDGERWDASGGGNRLTIQLPEGSHRVEIRKPGFREFSTTVVIRRGETATLNVSLAQE